MSKLLCSALALSLSLSAFGCGADASDAARDDADITAAPACSRNEAEPECARSRFDALDAAGKREILWPGYGVRHSGDFIAFDDAFAQEDVDLEAVAKGEAYDKAHAALEMLAERASSEGADAPAVFALVKDDLVYAYAIAIDGRDYGDWGEIHVYARSSFDEIGVVSWST